MNIIPLFMCPIFMQDLDFDLKPIQKECIYRSKKDKGRIKSNTNPLNSCVWEIEPVENRLLIFPSWLEHQVLPNITQKDRISLSFNIDTL